FAPRRAGSDYLFENPPAGSRSALPDGRPVPSEAFHPDEPCHVAAVGSPRVHARAVGRTSSYIDRAALPRIGSTGGGSAGPAGRVPDISEQGEHSTYSVGLL